MESAPGRAATRVISRIFSARLMAPEKLYETIVRFRPCHRCHKPWSAPDARAIVMASCDRGSVRSSNWGGDSVNAVTLRRLIDA
jgi:hypothetical protein